MADKTIEAGILLSGEKEFKTAVTSINKGLTSMKSELSLVSAECEGQANTLESLRKKNEVLNKIWEEQKRKVSATKDGLDNARESYDNVGKGLEKLWVDLEKATDKMQDLENTYGAASEEAQRQQRVVDDLAAAIERGEANYRRAGDRVRDWETRLNTAEAQVIRANREVNRNAAYLREAESSTNHCAESIDEFGREIRRVTADTESFGDVLRANLSAAAIEKGASALKEAGSQALAGATDMQTAANQVQASTGTAAEAMEKYKNVMEDVYTNNYGDNLEDIAQVVSTIMQNMGELDRVSLQNITENAITLRDVFEMDLDETLRGSKSLMYQFGLTAEEAFDLIGKGAQSGLDYTHELGDNVSEYSGKFAQAGYNAEEYFQLLKNGTSNGAYNLDKINDAINEVTNKMADGSIEGALDIYSVNTQNLFRAWQNGGATQRQVIDSIVADINNCTNQQDALTMAATAFGTMGEDSNLKFVQSLTSVGDGFKDVQGKMNEIKEIKYDDLNSQITEISRSIQVKLGDQIQKMLPTISNGLEVIANNLNLVTSASIGLAATILTNKLFKSGFFEAAIRGIRAFTTATQGATIAQRLLNAATAAGPMGLIAIGLGVATTALLGYTFASEEAEKGIDSFSKELAGQADVIERTNGELKDYIDTSKKWRDNTEAEWVGIENSTSRLIELNEQIKNESLSTDEANAKKTEMKATVESLASALPELAAAYNEETGSIDLTDDAIRNLLQTKKDYALVAGAVQRQEELSIKLYEAERVKADAQAKYDDAKIKRDEAYKNKTLGIFNTKEFKYWDEEANRLSGILGEAIQNYDDLSNEFEGNKGYIEENAESVRGLTEETEKNNKAAESAAKVTQAQEEALESLQNKYEEIKNSIQQSMEQKINLFAAFDGGDKTSLDDMLSNLESQLTGLSNWKTNMETLAGEVGKTIGPELYNELVKLGPDAANAVQEMVDALDPEKGDPAKLKEISKKYAELFDLTEPAAEKIASVQAVIQTALGEMGDSSKVDFSNLQRSIDSAVDNAAEGWAGLSDETRAALNQAVEAAKQSGAKIPDGLADGIKSGEISPADAIAQLNGSVQAQFDFLAGMADDAGIKIPQDIKDGIAAGGPEAVAALQKLAQLFGEASTSIEEETQKSGEKAAQNMADGVTNQSGVVTDAAENVAKEAGEAANKYTSTFQSTGSNMMVSMARGMSEARGNVISTTGGTVLSAISRAQEYSFSDTGYNLMAGLASGVNAGSDLVYEAVRRVVKQAKDEANKEADSHSPSRVFRDQVGLYIAQGMALGMQDGKQGVIDQAVGLARAALKGTTDELEIRSPSGVFKKKVGKQIAHGVAFGIKENKKAAKDEAEKLSKEIYSAATKWMSSYKKASKSHKTATMQNLENELHYWKEVKKALNEGTTAYKNAEKKITAYKKKIADKKQAIEDKKNFGVSGGSLDVYKTYYNASAKQEVDYWNIVRKTKGLSKEQKLEADQNYLAAVEELNGQLKDLNQDYEDNVKETNEQMIESIKEVTEAYEDAVKDRKESILSSFGLFDEFYSESESGDKLLYNLRTQVAGIADWEKELEELQSRGKLSDAVMEELKEMGPAASASIHALNDLTDAELEEYNNLYAKRDELAASQAAKDTERLRAESEAKIQQIKADAQAQIDTYKKEYDVAYAEITKSIDSSLRSLANKATTLGESATISMVKKIGETAAKKSTKQEVKKSAEKIASGFEGLPKEGKKIGRDTLQGILDGLMDGKRIKGGADDFIQSLSKAIKASAGIKSPSRLFKNEVGVQIPAGVGEGIQEGTKKATVAGTKMISDLLAQAQEKVKGQQAALANYAESLNSSARIGALNNLISTPPQVSAPVNVDNSAVIAMLGQIMSVMEEYLPQVANMQMVTDTGALIGETSVGMSESFAMAVRRMRK